MITADQFIHQLARTWTNDARLNVFVDAIEQILEGIPNMATQADIDAITTQVTQVAADLDTTKSALQAEIDTLAGQGVDVTALQAAIAPLDANVVALGQIVPAPPAV